MLKIVSIALFTSVFAGANAANAGFLFLEQTGKNGDKIDFSYLYKFNAHPVETYPGNGIPFATNFILGAGGGTFFADPQILGTFEDHGSKSFHNVEAIANKADPNGDILWNFKGTAKVQPGVANPPLSIKAITQVTYKGKTKTINSGDIKEKIKNGSFVGKDPVLSISLSPVGIDSEISDLINLEYRAIFGATPSLGLTIGLGPKSGQQRSFDLEYSYKGLSCTLTALTPACDQSFTDSLITGLTDPAFWSFDNANNGFLLTQDLDLPVIGYNYIGGSDISAGVVPTYSTTSEDDGVEVPGPVPLLGVGAAFGYSRQLRKRIRSNKSLEEMSAID